MPIFLFTDIEGSTKKWEQHPEQMKSCLRKHDTILKESIENNGGKVIKHTGDGFFAVFKNGDPLKATVEIQKRLAKEDWGEINEIRVRIGLHAGDADEQGKDYFGQVVNRTARVMGAAWGGQILITPEVKECVTLPANAILKDMGMHVLKDLGDPQHILQFLHPDLQIKEFPPIHSLSAHPHNLPVQTTPFLGREEELAEIIKLLEDAKCRLLTLIGPGGIGKTRLALQAAAEKIERFTHGVFFIALDPLSSAELLITAVAETIKFQFYSHEDEKEQLLNFLQDKELLLIMDNFEHLVDGAGIIGDILNRALNVKILVTSRELLNLRGEWIVQLQGLQVPPGKEIDIEGYSAVQLFLYNAHRIKANVTWSAEDRSYVARICQLVGGLPLGIEIASSWLRSLTCKEIAQEIEKNYDFLATSMRDIPDRHRSLRAVFEYSWKLITPQEQNALKKISVFSGGFTREAAKAIADADVTILASLTDKSLLYRDNEGRYRIFEILRQYAEEKLSKKEKQTVYEKHCAYFMQLLSDNEKYVKGDINPERFTLLRNDLENIRKAYDHAILKQDVALLDKAPVTLFYFFCHYGWLHDGKAKLKKAADVLKDNKDERAQNAYHRFLQRYAMFQYYLGYFDEALVDLHPCALFFTKIDDKAELAQVYMSMGTIEVYTGKYDTALQHYKQVYELFKEQDDKPNMAGILNNIGVIHWYKREYEKAKQMYKKCLTLGNELKHRKTQVLALGNLGIIAQEQGEYKEALSTLTECLKLEQLGGDKLQIASTLNNLGVLYAKMEQYDKAGKVYIEALHMREEAGDRMAIANSLYNLGQHSLRLEEFDEAMSYFQHSKDIRIAIGDKRGTADSLGRLAEVRLTQDKYDDILPYLREALCLGMESGYEVAIAESLIGLMCILDTDGMVEETFRVSCMVEVQNIYNDDTKERFTSLMKSLKKKIPAAKRRDLEKHMSKKKIKPFIQSLLKKIGKAKSNEHKEGDL